MKHVAIFFFIWLILSIIGFGVGSLVFNQNSLQQFTDKGIPIYGKVIATEPENHQLIQYEYVIAGNQYTGAGNAGRGNPNFDQIQIGQQVVVFYDPKSPENSILGYPQLYSRSNYFGVLFSAILFPVFPIITIYALYRIIFPKTLQK